MPAALSPRYCTPPPGLPPQLRRRRIGRDPTPASAKKPNSDGGENSQPNEPNLFNTNLRISRSLVAKSACVVFGLGFLDAGYSGDWSRTGVISKETEEVLKMAAYVVLPLCLLPLYLVPNEEKTW